jgi:4-amino-4-deoxychorismate lyase
MLVLINGEITDQISVFDRGLQYGDGVFETIRFRDCAPVLLPFHLDRLVLGAQRLNIPMPRDFASQYEKAIALRKQLADADLQESGSYICKIILTRGGGGRGYRASSTSASTLIISFHDLPNYPEEYKTSGVSTMICHHPLSENASIAGIKHLNRLDQVIASAELAEFPEGIMCDQQGRIVEGTRSNILLFSGEKVYTPVLEGCGVDGCLRRFLLEQSKLGLLNLDVTENKFHRDKLNDIEGLAFINSVFGLWPVSRVIDRVFSITPECKLLAQFIDRELGI